MSFTKELATLIIEYESNGKYINPDFLTDLGDLLEIYYPSEDAVESIREAANEFYSY